MVWVRLLGVALALILAGCGEGATPPPPATRTATATTGTASAPEPTRATLPATPGTSPTPELPRATPSAAAEPARPAEAFDPQAFRLSLERVAAGFSQPTFVTHAGDGSDRLFVVEKAGVIRIIAGETVRPQPFLDISSRVRSSGSEQGLLGLAFHPGFRQNGRLFVFYTASNSDNTLVEYRVSGDPNRADPTTGTVLLAIPDFAPNHNGGMLAFGRDGYLYAGTGDGGGAGDPQRNGQNRGALLGKLLRLDVDRGQPYGTPSGNPFVGVDGARPEVWAYGLRNPWRFSFDRKTGDLWVADVGQNAWEEINRQPAASRGGENYGWSIMEATHCFRPSAGCDAGGLTLPIAEYGHGLGCSVTGGYVYRGRRFPVLAGAYFYGDYCSGRIWALSRDQGGTWRQTELLKTEAGISSFGEDEAGEVYLTGLNDGRVYRLAATTR